MTITQAVRKILHQLPPSVSLIAVLKNRSSQEVKEAITAGISHIGENRIQEAERHFRELGNSLQGITKHFIGHLQSNKVRKAVQLFDVIQTVDAEKLAQGISKEAQKAGKIQQVMIQVNIGREDTKSGALPEHVEELCAAAKLLPNIDVIGLMCIPSALPQEEVRPYFKRMKRLQHQLQLRHLSMGMSEDYLVACEEGSTMVRLGRAIFG